MVSHAPYLQMISHTLAFDNQTQAAIKWTNNGVQDILNT